MRKKEFENLLGGTPTQNVEFPTLKHQNRPSLSRILVHDTHALGHKNIEDKKYTEH